MQKCRKIEIDQEELDRWRFLLYSSVFSVWTAIFFTFIIPSSFRFFFHGFFLIGVINNLKISIPSWICKKLGYGGTCNCDWYEYYDFPAMVIVGFSGALTLSIFDLNISEALLVLTFFIAISITIYYALPQKEPEVLKYPSELLIEDIDNLQKFLMTNPQSTKLIVVMDAKCDFCEIQVNEINKLSKEHIDDNLRILDLTFSDELDPVIPITLNIKDTDNLPVPTTFVFDSGMMVEQKDGVLSSQEIRDLLHPSY